MSKKSRRKEETSRLIRRAVLELKEFAEGLGLEVGPNEKGRTSSRYFNVRNGTKVLRVRVANHGIGPDQEVPGLSVWVSGDGNDYMAAAKEGIRAWAEGK